MDMLVEQQHAHLLALAEARFMQSMTIPETFFTSEVEKIAQSCWAMARRFHAGGRLIAFGNGASATDAQHVAVEFVYPVIVGKRALPALALTNDSATLSGLMGDGDASNSFAHQLRILARPQDIAMSFSVCNRSSNIETALTTARQMGLLTLDLTGNCQIYEQEAPPASMEKLADFSFVVRAQDPTVIQETQETLYHVLWELVHVFFEHKGLLDE
jgi:D-sedoheptulose 7-phosphate isomerase